MYLIIGLGNPGKQYEKTRHNMGFMVLDKFQKEHGFPRFTLSRKHSSLLSEDILNEIKVALAKPQTLMNNSGKAVASLTKLSFPKLNLVKELVVVHDDIDIPLGQVKISQGKGSAGHKGIESIIQSLGTKNFTRVRIGIQPQKGKPKDVENFVLKKFAASELPLLESAIQKAGASLSSLVD